MPTGEEEIDFYTLKYMAATARHLAHEALLEAFDASGLTKAALAKRLKWDPSRVSRLINTPANITVETFGELLFAIDGSSPDFQCEKLLDERCSNYNAAHGQSSSSLPHQNKEAKTMTTKQTMTFSNSKIKVLENA